MRLLDLPQAEHFCNPTPADVAAVGVPQSLRAFHLSIAPSVTQLTEGQTNFKVHQVNMLWDIDRWLLFSVTHYRRAMDMLVPASAPWAQVTLYYASFFAANAILGMFGGWVGQVKGSIRIVEVAHGAPGAQQLKIHRRLDSPNKLGGSHQKFWDFFYDAAPQVSAWAPIRLASALQPVNGIVTWQIGERNDVNYDMYHAWNTAKLFNGQFRPDRLSSLSGPLQLQLEATETLIKLALHFASELELSTMGLDGSGHPGTASQVRRKLGSQRPPQLVMQSEFQELIAQ